MPSKLLSPEKFTDHVMLLFFFVQRLKTIAVRFPTILSKQTATSRSSGCCKQKQIKFELYGDLVDQAFSQFSENLINN